jgi:hypothetical protein
MKELVLNTFETDCNSNAKSSAGNIRTSCLKYANTNFFTTTELLCYTLEATSICMPKMMLLATQSSCLTA